MPVKKFIARDCELSTTGFDDDGNPLDCWDVTQKVLAQIGPILADRNVSTWSSSGFHYGSRYSMDCLRKWTSGGQCYYSDMGHVEVCSAEVLRPREFAAQSISMLRAAEAACKLAEAEERGDAHFALAASNVDGLSPDKSWGTHVNVSVSNELWEDLFIDNSHPARLAFVASAFAAAIPFFGAGYVMPRPGCEPIFSLSGRVHHLTKVHTLSTTESFRRGVLNSRREPHGNQDRLHLIGFDYCIGSSALMASFVQCVLAAAEEGFCGDQLYSPVDALHTWSHCLDPATGKVEATATAIDGKNPTLPAYMCRLTEKLLAMCESGLISEDVAPEAMDLLPRIIDLAHYVEEGSVHLAARHLDWAAKLICLLARGEPLDSPGARLADHDFSNTDPQRGLLWRLIDEQQVDPLVTIDAADACLLEPPPETRAWGRGQLIKRFGEQIAHVNWSRVELRMSSSYWGSRLSIEMPDLDGMNRDTLGPLLELADDVADLRRLLQHNQHQHDPDVAQRISLR